MLITNCTWDYSNLGVSTVEVSIDRNDIFTPDIFKELNLNYQYVVIKVPMCLPSFNLGLSELGFSIIETQINLSKKFIDFDFQDRFVKQHYSETSLQIIDNLEGLDALLSRITPDMFSTDRITLDPYFNPNLSAQRYRNWIRSEFVNKTGIVQNIFYGNKNIGFELSRHSDNGIIQGLLGGIFRDYQASGYGLVLASIHFFEAKKYNTPLRRFKTAISSNNIPMLQLYDYLCYKIDGMSYVFIKHNA